MKLIATSDLHGNLEGLDFTDCDICIIAGDFAKLNGFGEWNYYNQKKWIENEFIPFLKKYPKTQFCIVAGNHDMVMDSKQTMLFPDINFVIKWPKHVHILNNSKVEINGLKIYGTPLIPIISYRWAFETEGVILKERFKDIPENLDILITHTPPHISDSCKIDCSLQFGGSEAFGSSELAEAILEKKPKYVFCGHIHSGDHNLIHIGDSKIYNVSRLDENYIPFFEPLKLEI